MHGAGEGAIRQWGRDAIAWLNDHPGRCVSWGDGDGDVLSVLRRQVRLLSDSWFGPAHAARMEANRGALYPDDQR